MGAQTPPPRIETSRLRLRPPGSADAVYIAELANDLDVAWMTTGVPHPFRVADAAAFLAGCGAEDGNDGVTLLIEHMAFGPIGMMGFHRQGRFSELGFWLGRTFRGRGFATEAVHAALDWARDGWGRRAVLSSHFADNPASARVLDKAGFLYTGEVQARYSAGRGQTAPTRMMIWLA